jgi:hypothetical protein
LGHPFVNANNFATQSSVGSYVENSVNDAKPSQPPHGTTTASNDPAVTVYYLLELKLAVAPVKGQAVNILKTTHQVVLNAIRDYDMAAVFTDTNNKLIQLTKFPDSKETFDEAFMTHEQSGSPPPQVMIGFSLSSGKPFSAIKKIFFIVSKRSTPFFARTSRTLGPRWIQSPSAMSTKEILNL